MLDDPVNESHCVTIKSGLGKKRTTIVPEDGGADAGAGGLEAVEPPQVPSGRQSKYPQQSAPRHMRKAPNIYQHYLVCCSVAQARRIVTLPMLQCFEIHVVTAYRLSCCKV